MPDVIPRSRYRRPLSAACSRSRPARSGKVDFGLRLAERANPLQCRRTRAAGARTADHPQGARRAGRIHVPAQRSAACLDMEEQDGSPNAKLAFDVGRPIPIRQSIELGLGFLHRSLQQLFRERWKPQTVCFTHAPPSKERCSSAILRHRYRVQSGFQRHRLSARATSMRPCRPQMQRWRGMRSNISTRLRRAARAP